MKPVVLYFDPVTPQMKELLEEFAGDDLQIQFYHQDQKIESARYFLVAAEKIPKAFLETTQCLRLIQKTGAGVDNIDTDEARQRGIPVCNTPGVNAAGVAELTLAHILALYRKLPLLNECCHMGKWPMWEHRLTSYELGGKIHGIIGMGSIGKYVAKLSQAFGTILVYHDIHRATKKTELQYGIEYLELPKLLQTSDIISLHIPLSTGTRYLIDTKEITLMKSTAVIINMSRGGVVNETALAAALTSGRIAGAACDTLEGEPNIEGHPLLSCPNFHCTPHVGAGTNDTLRRVLTIAFANIRAVEKGKKPQFIVNECTSSQS